VNPQFDSALEARFIEALRRLSGKPGMPLVQLAQTVMPGKTGFILQVGDAGDNEHRYEIEPQVDLGPEVGVAVQSRPDFVIRPRSVRSGRRPIAVFCDGWAYHKDSTRADGLKRSAIVASGRYWVLSVTHHDVESAIAGDVGTQLESPLVSHARHDGSRAAASLPRATSGTFQKNAVAFLLGWLAGGADDAKGSAPEVRARDWAWATYLMVPPPGEGPDAQVRMASFQAKAPTWVAAHKPTPSVVAVSKEGAAPEVALYWPAAWMSGAPHALVTPQMLLFDDRQDRPEDARQLQWRNWLRLYNWAQFIPGAVLGTHAGLEAGEYDVLQPVAPVPGPGHASVVAVPASDGGWSAVIADAVSSLHAGLRTLAETSAPAPDEVGYEWSEGGGNVALEAELAWVERKVVLLVGPQSEYAPGWQAEGWTAITAEGEWVPMLLAALNAGEA
jgi:DEAD/DEAH box helicase domain-containing protein